MVSRLGLGQGMGASQGSMIRCRVRLRGLVAEWLCQRGVGRWRVQRLARVRLVGKGAGGAKDRLRLGRLGLLSRVFCFGLMVLGQRLLGLNWV